MNSTVPSALFQALAWAGSAVPLVVAVIEWRLGSVYHTLLALSIVALTFFASRGQRPTWVAMLLLGAILVFGIYRAWAGLALLRGA
ncbi:hypothetical protein Q0M94_22865 (plasmid) [Deinococcus radiomollis]|uniref:hypothetical protein n=1 Tax=Deinococcus radiomollis TaxID=468916 RepID=UPI0038913EAC